MKMKRFLTLMLAFSIMLMGLRTPVYAQETNEVLDVYMDTSEYDEINKELEEYGRSLRERKNENSRGVYLLLPVDILLHMK